MRGSSAWWYVFVIAFVAAGLAETFLPERALPSSTPRRWASNSILLAVSTLLVFLAYELSGIALACTVAAASRGLLNVVNLPYYVRFAIGFAALDLTAYASHRAFHAVAPLWRVHRVHHSETDLDLTTGLRFHPVEAVLVQGLWLAVIAVLGVPAGAVALGGLAVVVQDFFTHANLRLPQGVDRWLRFVIITPAMHRVHHYEGVPEQNTNFGTIFSLWDRVFGTYNAGFPAGADTARCGLAEIAHGSELSGVDLLILPFREPLRGPSRGFSQPQR